MRTLANVYLNWKWVLSLSYSTPFNWISMGSIGVGCVGQNPLIQFGYDGL